MASRGFSVFGLGFIGDRSNPAEIGNQRFTIRRTVMVPRPLPKPEN
jgi:hypothetical protein